MWTDARTVSYIVRFLGECFDDESACCFRDCCAVFMPVHSRHNSASCPPPQPQPHSPVISVPESSVRRAQDRGLRAHTNILINLEDAGSVPGSNWETPASIACIYEMVPQVPGCPINATTSLPNGGGGVIAIVDAYDDPTAANDLTAFSNFYGLSQPQFRVVFANGQRPQQDPTGGWEVEESLDIEWAHAMAPNALIYLVEAASSSNPDLYAAENVASGLATNRGVVSNSWGGQEFSGEQTYDSYFETPGVVYIASSGDSDQEVDYPASSPYVIAAGGTSIVRDSSGSYTGQSYWNTTCQGAGGGGGLSAYESRPAYQNTISSLVGSFRGIPDISSDANPCTGVAVYDSTPYNGTVYPWMLLGGTSVAAPTLAGRIITTGFSAYSTQDMLTELYGMYSAGLAYPNYFLDVSSGGSNCNDGWNTCDGIGTPLTNYWQNYSLSSGFLEGNEQEYCKSYYNGQCRGIIYDSGTITLLIDGTDYSTSYGETSTQSELASSLATVINASSNMSAEAIGIQLYVQSKTSSCFSISGSSASSLPRYFSTPSFTISISTPGCNQ